MDLSNQPQRGICLPRGNIVANASESVLGDFYPLFFDEFLRPVPRWSRAESAGLEPVFRSVKTASGYTTRLQSTRYSIAGSESSPARERSGVSWPGIKLSAVKEAVISSSLELLNSPWVKMGEEESFAKRRDRGGSPLLAFIPALIAPEGPTTDGGSRGYGSSSPTDPGIGGGLRSPRGGGGGNPSPPTGTA